MANTAGSQEQGEETFNAHGKGFQEGWRAAEQWMKEQKAKDESSS